MVQRALLQRTPSPDGPPIREYGWIFLVLFVWTVLSAVGTIVVSRLSMVLPRALDPRWVGAIVYTAVGLAALATAYGVARRHGTIEDPLETHELVQFGGTATLLMLVGGYVVVGATDVPPFPVDLVSGLLIGPIAMGLLALGYARVHGFGLRIEFPDRKAVPHVVAAVVATVLVGLAFVLALVVTNDPSLGSPISGFFGGPPSFETVLWTVVAPSLLTGIGWGFLYHGAIQERLRSSLDPARAAAAVTALIGILTAATGILLRTGDPVVTAGTSAGVVLLGLVGAVVSSQATGLLARRREATLGPVQGAAVGVIVVVAPLIAATAVLPWTSGVVVSALSFAVATAVAVVGYERTRSAWVPALVFATYFVVVNTNVARYLAGLFG